MENNLIRRNTINPIKVAKASWKYGAFVYVFLFMFIIYCAMNQHINWGGVMTILTHTAAVGTIALGMGLIIISGEIDLSVGSIFAFSGGLGILTYNDIVTKTGNTTGAMIATLIVMVALSAVIGFINGWMVGKIKMPAFIATLGTMLIFRSLCKFILKSIPMEGGGQQQTYQVYEYFSSPFYNLGNDDLITIPIVGIVLIVLTLAVFYFAKHTKFGRKVYALGSNPKASSLAGINVPMSKVAIFTIAGALTGVAAFLHTGIYGSMDSSTAGLSYELYAIASCVIGGIAMTGGRGNIIGILFGAMSFQIIDKIISVANLNPLINDTIKGSILLVAVVLQVLVIDKGAVDKFMKRVGLKYDENKDQVLESELRKKVNNVKLAYDKKFNKVLANKAINKEEADRLINSLLDEREAKIVALNEKYNLLIDNAKLHAREKQRELAIKKEKLDAKNLIKDMAYTMKVNAKHIAHDNAPIQAPVLTYKIEATNDIKAKAIELENNIATMDDDVTVLTENAKHILDRDNNQAVYDATIAAINEGKETNKQAHIAAISKINEKYDAEVAKLEALLKENEGKADEQAKAHEVVLAKREAANNKKQAKLDLRKAKADAKAKQIADDKTEAEARKEHLDAILKSRGMH